MSLNFHQRGACGVLMVVLAVPAGAGGTSGAVVFGSWIASHYADAACETVSARLEIACSVRAVTVDGRRYHRAASADMDEVAARALGVRARANGFSAWFLASQSARAMGPEPGGGVVSPMQMARITQPEPLTTVAHAPAITISSPLGSGDSRLHSQVVQLRGKSAEDRQANPEPVEGEVPDTAMERSPPLEWWRAFRDPVLDQVVDAALASSLDLAQAVARVAQARARARVAGASQLPMAQAALGATTFDAPTNAGIGAQLDELGLGAELYDSFGVRLPDRIGLSTYTLGADFAYEADFWGRNRNAALSAGAQRLASEADYRAARIGVISETVATYLEVVDLRGQRAFAGQIADVLDEQAALTRERYDAGLADIRELYAVERTAVDAQANLPRIDAGRAETEARLWVLLGGYSADLDDLVPETLTPITPLQHVPSGIPADLLVQRPDVNAARQRVEAARYALGARRAALLPSLSLSGSIGLESSSSGDWFDPDQWYRNLSANLLAPVFQGGRLRGNVALAEAQLDEAVASYGRSVVTAVNEVDAALTALRANRHRVSLLTGFAGEAAAEEALQDRRYRSGVGDYSTLLAASHHLLGAKSTLARGERDLGLARLALHRALGGGWTAPDDPVSLNQRLPRDRPSPKGFRARLKDFWTKHVTGTTQEGVPTITE
ncbi:MAG: efflux transporter outer membrane subunit [Gammaproteobacteria bacterium]|nr:efflux transporter outer membrane subunit [Gammaproteobacteria bacterium]